VTTLALGRTAPVRSALAAAIPLKRGVLSTRSALGRALPAGAPLAGEMPIGLTPIGI